MSAELVTWGGDAMPDGVTISRPPADAVQLTRAGARKLTDTIRRNLERTLAGLVRAWHGRAHEALGYGAGPEGWQAYTAAEFGDLKLLALPDEERNELIESMTAAGHSRREVARNLKVSPGTVSHVIKGRPAAPAAGTVEHLDDRRSSPSPVVEPPAGMSKRDRAVQLIAEQGERGLTSLELHEVTGWTGGSAAGTLSDVKRQGRVVATEVFRRGYAAHVIAEGVNP